MESIKVIKIFKFRSVEIEVYPDHFIPGMINVESRYRKMDISTKIGVSAHFHNLGSLDALDAQARRHFYRAIVKKYQLILADKWRIS